MIQIVIWSWNEECCDHVSLLCETLNILQVGRFIYRENLDDGYRDKFYEPHQLHDTRSCCVSNIDENEFIWRYIWSSRLPMESHIANHFYRWNDRKYDHCGGLEEDEFSKETALYIFVRSCNIWHGGPMCGLKPVLGFVHVRLRPAVSRSSGL